MRTRMTKIEDSLSHLLVLIRSNFIVLVATYIIVIAIDYKDFFGRDSDEVYYLAISSVVLFLSLLTLQKYRTPLHYWPRYVFFVKDRNDLMIKMEPYFDPWLIWLGLIRPQELVNVRYSMYPDLDLGVDINSNTGVITGFPMELGNHTSEIKMGFLGGSYSTKVRIEVIDTLKEKMIHQRDEFAPPRTVAQLLVREEDMLKREQDLDYDMSQRQAILNEEYKSKELNFNESIDVEKGNFAKKLVAVKKDYELQLKEKNSKITSINKEMESKLKEFEDDSNLKIEKLEAEMIETLQDKEREFVEFEKEIKSRFEDKEREFIDIEGGMKEKLEQSEERADNLELLSLETGAAAADMEKELLEILENMSTASEEEIVDTESLDSLKKIEAKLRHLKPKFQEAVKNNDEEAINEMQPILEGLISQREDFLDKDSDFEEEEPEEVVEEPEYVVEKEPEEVNYDSMTVPQLKKLLKEKGLPVSGKKEELIARLKE
jgi:hypothetical protein